MVKFATASIVGVALLALIGIVPPNARAQDARGTILGTVTDSSGGVVPDAKVEAVNPATNVKIPTVTNDDGNFRIPFLAPGRYTVTVSKAGFKTYVHPDIEVRIADSVEVKIALQVGGTTESVQVNATADLLQTTEASQSATITQKELDEVPIQGGSVLEVLGYAPGMAKTGELRTPYPAWNQGLTMFSSNGAGEGHFDMTLDGVANESIGVPGQSGSENGFMRPAISLSSYSVEEMKIQTNVYDATLGHTNGMVFNMVSRSGTNQLHGEGHYFFYPSSLAAENPFNRGYVYYNTASQQRYGFSLGGPVFIPKVYNGKNKTFFFFTMERHPFKTPAGNQGTVPTAAERGGDFSALLALGSNYQIYDPLSIATSGGTLQRTAFPGNIIPASRLDPVAQNLLKYISLPNATPQSANGQNNLIWVDPGVDNYNTYATRIDHNFSDKHRLMGRFNWDNWFESAPDEYYNGTTGQDQYRHSYVAALDDVYVFSPNVVLDLKAGVTRQPYTNGPPDANFNYKTLGFAPGMTNLIANATAIFPSISFGGSDIFDGIGAGGGYYSNQTNETVNGTLSWQKGKHSIRFGAEGRFWTQSYMNTYNNTSPSLSFNGAYTNGPNYTSPSAPAGQGLAQFLLGIPSGASMGISTPFTAQYNYAAMFVQDDWKVTPKLTLNLGMRWELELPTTERFNRMEIGFNPSATPSYVGAAQSAYAGTGFAQNAAALAAASTTDPAAQAEVQSILAGFPSSLSVSGGYIYASPSNRGRWQTNWKQFLPRFGLAYQADSKTVVRAGFGIFYDTLGVGRNSFPVQDGFSRSTYQPSSLDNGVSFLSSLENPFPNGLLQPVGSSLGADLGAGGSLYTGYAPNVTEPYSMHWSVGIQRELPGKFVIDANYVASKSAHMVTWQNGCGGNGIPCNNFNNIPRQYLSTSPTLDQTNIDMLSALVPNPYNGLPQFNGTQGPTTSVSQLLMPYSQYGSIGETVTNGSAFYNSLQARVERRFSSGFTIATNFTWSNSMQNVNYLNATDPAPVHEVAYAPSLTFNAMMVYELPFGKNRHFGNSWHGPLNWALGEWQVSGTFRLQNGYPAALTDLLLNSGMTLRDLQGQRDPVNFFNVAALNTDTSVQPGWDHLRTLPTMENYLRGPGFWVSDGAISKKVTIKERIKGEFRFESYNATNHLNNWPYMVINSYNPTGAQFNTRQNGLPRTFEMGLRATF